MISLYYNNYNYVICIKIYLNKKVDYVIEINLLKNYIFIQMYLKNNINVKK